MGYIIENHRFTSFVKNFEVIEEALKELTSLGSQLQRQNLSLTDAHKIITDSVEIFKVIPKKLLNT